jgi:UDPglucose--hexose-1-phosphate uridylyltransferase
MEFERRAVSMEILAPARDFQPLRLDLEQRWDPLTGQGCRLLPPLNLFAPPIDDLGDLVAGSAATCPFCPERVEVVTPRFPPDVIPDGRLHQGEAVLFPNLHPYARYSSVAVFSPHRHLLPLADMTPTLVADNLAVQVRFAREVTGYDPATPWVSVNANHLPPSGSSLLHPHTQGSVHPFPTAAQRSVADLPVERFREYVDAERAAGERYLGSTGTIDWLAAFAPAGPAELRAVLFGAGSPQHLDDARVAELGYGIATALNLYAELGFTSYNMALYGAPDGHREPVLLLRMVCRSNPRPWYRSDVMWLERLHGEAAVDVWPEHVAERAGDRFVRGTG